MSKARPSMPTRFSGLSKKPQRKFVRPGRRRHARQRQGTSREQTAEGQDLLDQWGADFSECRTVLPDREVEAIIRDGPNKKRI